MELGHDFMGYSLQKGDMYTFHHLIVPARNGGPYSYWNGVMLFTTPHQYLHAIENVDHKYFDYISSEMQDMKVKGFLDGKNLQEINDILCEFEWRYRHYHTNKGNKLITPQRTRRIYNKH